MGSILLLVLCGIAVWLVFTSRSVWLALVLVAIVIMCSGCSSRPYVELGVGTNKSFTNTTHPWESGGGAAFVGEAGLQWEHPNDMVATKCRYLHVSQWFVGPPFNQEPESSLDHFGCAVKVFLTR